MRIVPGQQLLFCPIGGGMSDSIYTGSSADDHSGGSDAGVAYGRDPSGGEMAYQFGNLWVSSPAFLSCVFLILISSFDMRRRISVVCCCLCALLLYTCLQAGVPASACTARGRGTA
jgi:hypothetical protein